MVPGYSILEKLYTGRRRVVYRALREEDRSTVILKSLLKELPSSQDLTNLKHEFDVLTRLQAPGVIKAFDLAQSGKSAVLVLEDIQGQPLSELIGLGDVDLPAFLRIASKLAATLEAIHRHGVVHRDLNPKNIIFNKKDEELRIIDFGISSLFSEGAQGLHRASAPEGTPAYMSPEQTGRVNRAVDQRTDFYSLGISFYEMLTGRLPFRTDDPLQLLHAHIAKQPPAPHEVKTDIPPVVASIVMKLLAKAPEDRYQSAEGIQVDLQECQRQWSAAEKIEDFPLGINDRTSIFQIPQRLYGRGVETERLLSAFRRATNGSAQLLLVRGYSGVGKSALINEVQVPILDAHGHFIAGKFEQLQRTVPYSAIATAFQQLIRQLLTESESALESWKGRLQTALGSNAQVIVDVIPDVELVIGPQPPAAELGPTESQNRFRLVFQNFTRVFCSKESPLVLFLDDLQWVDAASLRLLEFILTDEDTRHLLVIGAYRDNEVGADHPLSRALQRLRDDNATTEEISLSPLGADHMSQLVAETLYRDGADVGPLVELLKRKTDGNPFFLRQFLRTLCQEKLFGFDPDSRSWRWGIEEIEAMDITNNVVDLMVRKLRRLPEATQVTLRQAACIGHGFDLPTLSVVSGTNADTTSGNLQPALAEGLIVRSRDPLRASQRDGETEQTPTEAPRSAFRFLHDRVQQAAYELIDESERDAVHLRIGRQMLFGLSESEKRDRIFEIADHLNLGRRLIEDDRDDIDLVGVNLVAGEKAKESTAYAAAREYFRAALECLAPDSWSTDYDRCMELHTRLAESEYLNGEFDRSREMTNEVLKEATSATDRATVYDLLVRQYTLSGEYETAIETVRKALSELEIDLPEDDLATALTDELGRIRSLIGDRSTASLIDEPEMTEATKMIAARLLASLCPLAYIASPELCRLAGAKLVRLSLEHGHTPDCALGYSFLGLTYASGLGEYRKAFDYAQLGIRLSERFQDDAQKCRTTHVFIAFINHWSRHIKFMKAVNDQGFQAGLASGELQFAGYHRYNRALCLYYEGKPLAELLPELDELAQFSRKTKNQHGTDPIVGVQLVARNLTGKTTETLGFDGESFSESDFKRDLQARNARPAWTHYHVVKSHALYLHGSMNDALECSLEAEKTLSYVSGHFSVAAHNFYQSLILVSLCRATSGEAREKYLAKARRNQSQMKTWAEHCPENFQHRYLLVEAELGRLESDSWQAAILFSKSIAAAEKHNFIHDEAVAKELAAEFWLEHGNEKFAHVYLHEASHAYQQWGATRKVADLEVAHPVLRKSTRAPDDEFSGTVTMSRGSGVVLDLETVMKSSQAISGEIALPSLLERVIEIAIENAGAERGVLVLERDGRLFVGAEEDAQKRTNTLDFDELEARGNLCLAVVHLVRRTGESVIVADACRDTRVAGDPYVSDRAPKSILCVPVHQHGEIMGLFYLENNLTTHAFTPDRIEIIQVLAAQTAVSLKNAGLYEDLQEALSEVERLKDRLQAENIYLQDEIKSGHNFDFIVGESKELKELLGQLEQVAETDATVLVLGETGTGKELIARAVHSLSHRKTRPLIKVNCAALPANLVESELFGHEKGAFTGAIAKKIGRFELANGGTIFLDEIGDLPQDLQAKLLRVLQEGEFERLGNPQTIQVDVRVISATNRDLLKLVWAGDFRQDLYYRLNVFPLSVPPLRERDGDIPLLVQHFVKGFSRKLGREIQTIPQDVMATLSKYRWPGNVRELENVIERAVILTRGSSLQIDRSLSERERESDSVQGQLAPQGTLAEVERSHIERTLETTNWRIEGNEGAAKLLGLNPSTLRSRMQKLGLKKPSQAN